MPKKVSQVKGYTYVRKGKVIHVRPFSRVTDMNVGETVSQIGGDGKVIRQVKVMAHNPDGTVQVTEAYGRSKRTGASRGGSTKGMVYDTKPENLARVVAQPQAPPRASVKKSGDDEQQSFDLRDERTSETYYDKERREEDAFEKRKGAARGQNRRRKEDAIKGGLTPSKAPSKDTSEAIKRTRKPKTNEQKAAAQARRRARRAAKKDQN